MRNICNVAKRLIVVFTLLLVNQGEGGVKAQSDSFFNYDNNGYYRNSDEIVAPALPKYHGLDDNFQPSAPLGNGLLALSLLGVGYLTLKSRKNSGGKNKKSLLVLLILILGFGYSTKAQNFYFDKPTESSSGTNMLIYGQIQIDGEIQHENIEIGAFCNDEVRGRAFIKQVNTNYTFFLTIYGNNNDVITLSFYDHEMKTELNVYSDFNLTFLSDNTNPDVGTLEYHTVKYKFIGTDKDWSKVSNWQLVCAAFADPQSATQLPSSNPKMIDDIIVAENLDASSNYIVKNIEIVSGKTLTVTSVGSLNMTGDITNADASSLIIAADENGAASFLHNKDNVVATVDCNIDNSSVTRNWNADWHFISSPVASQTIESFIPTSENYDFYSWLEDNSTWLNQKKDNSSTNDFYTDNGSNFVKGKGYLVAYENADVKSFSGTLNNGTVSYPLSFTESGENLVEEYKGFNLIGNPYPSFIDWEAEGWTRDNLQVQTIWIYDDDVNNYTTYTLGGVATNGGSQYIAPCQGFFVKALTEGNLVMANDIRTNNKSSFRKVSKENIFKIKVEGKSGQDEIALVKDGNDDVFKMFSFDDNAPSLYINKGVDNYSVVYIDDEISLPLSFKSEEMSMFTISLSEVGSNFTEIYLEDRLTGEKVNLQTESYSFLHSKGNMKDRFLLTFANSQQPIANSNFAYIDNGNIIITGISGDATINIYDVTGRMIISHKDAHPCISTGDMSSGVYIIQKIDDKGIKNQKIVIE